MALSHRRAHARALRVVLFALVSSAWAVSVHAGEVFGTRKGKVYHTHAQECASARKIGQDNRVTFASEQEAKNVGRRLCKRCEALDRKAAEAGESKPGPVRKPPVRSDRGGGSGDPPRDAGTGGRGEPAESGPDSGGAPTEIAAVTKVLPGGTLALDNGENAVLIGVACPGARQAGASDLQRFISEQTRGRMVRLTYESSGCYTHRRDTLGRLLVYAVPEPDGRDLGGELIFQGYAWVDQSVPFARQGEYLRNEEEAWRAGRGVWRRGDDKAGGETVVTGRHARCYHTPNCRHVRLLVGSMSLTLDEAKARRLVPCSEYH